MIVAIHQPDYIPYPGYFYKIANCDIFVFLNDAQYSNVGFTNVNKVKTPQGELKLKIPVTQTLGDKICDVTTKDELGWKDKQLKILMMNYKRAEHFEEIYNDFIKILSPKYKNISEMNISIVKLICSKLGFKTVFKKSSDLKLETKKEERVIDICKAYKADIYLSGNGAKQYQIDEHFIKRGIELKYSNYLPINYNQLWGEFIPNLSILDYLFNYGYNWNYIMNQFNS